MDENELMENLMTLFEASDEVFEDQGICMLIERVRSFKECGLLTFNQGLVIEVNDMEDNKAEFQIQIVRSR